MLLRHLGHISYADTIENALLYTLEQGQHTSDFGKKGSTSLSTDAFAEAIISNFGKKPAEIHNIVDTGTKDFDFQRPQEPEYMEMMYSDNDAHVPEKIIGTDIFICAIDKPEYLAEVTKPLLPQKLELKIISNRGTQVWPNASKYTESVPLFSLRIELKDKSMTLNALEILQLASVMSSHLKVVGVAFLKEWGEMKGYSMVQGQ
jgi:isocitrate dehydrogenase